MTYLQQQVEVLLARLGEDAAERLAELLVVRGERRPVVGANARVVDAREAGGHGRARARSPITV